MTRGPHRVAAAFMAGKRTRHSTWILGTWRGMRLDGQDGPTLRAPADSLLAQLWALARAVADPAARLSLSLFSLHLFTVHTANSAFRRWHRRRKFATVFLRVRATFLVCKVVLEYQHATFVPKDLVHIVGRNV
jgi:hypothetical protein